MNEVKRLPAIPPYDLPGAQDLPPARPGWALDSSRAALLIHDMQQYFLAAFAPDAEPMSSVIPRIAALADRCRAAGMPVFYTAQKGNQDRRDRGLQADLWGPGMRAVAEHELIHAELAPQPGDFVLTKHRYSAFQRSNLERMMRVRGRDQLLITGIYAHIGCLYTAADAFQRDIEPFFVADALGDYSRSWHEASVEQVAATCGVVLDSRTVLETLQC